MKMKKTFLLVSAMCSAFSAYAANVEKEYDTTSSYTTLAHAPQGNAFAISFELIDINLEDIADTQKTLFTWNMEYDNEMTIAVQAMYGENGKWSFLVGNGVNDPLGYWAAQMDNPISELSGSFVFQYDSGAFSFGVLNSAENDYDVMLSTTGMVGFSQHGTTFAEAYSNYYAGAEMTSGSFTIDSIHAPVESVQNVKAWTGIPTVSEIVASNNKPVPEPTTTTLSLFALCGLAARRRRK